jgi:transposase InsO family protein
MRVKAWLKHREGIRVNHKRIQRLMKEHGLLATQTIHKAKRTPKRSKPKAKAVLGDRHDKIPNLLHWLDISGSSA